MLCLAVAIHTHPLWATSPSGTCGSPPACRSQRTELITSLGLTLGYTWKVTLGMALTKMFCFGFLPSPCSSGLSFTSHGPGQGEPTHTRVGKERPHIPICCPGPLPELMPGLALPLVVDTRKCCSPPPRPRKGTAWPLTLGAPDGKSQCLTWACPFLAHSPTHQGSPTTKK